MFDTPTDIGIICWTHIDVGCRFSAALRGLEVPVVAALYRPFSKEAGFVKICIELSIKSTIEELSHHGGVDDIKSAVRAASHVGYTKFANLL